MARWIHLGSVPSIVRIPLCMPLWINYILQVEVVDVRQSQLKSVVVEKVGCKRALDALMSKLNIHEFVTDASGQIIKLLGKCKFIIVHKMMWEAILCGHTH